MLELFRRSLSVIRSIGSIVDDALASRTLHKAREAARDSTLRREAWTAAKGAQAETKDSASVA